MVESSSAPSAARPAGPSTLKLGYIDERDLDLMLVLDAHRRGPLLEFLLERIGLRPAGELRAARSTPRCGGTRETDVEVWWHGGALLIENKVDASYTPGQPQSYVEEVQARDWVGERAAAVLVCPSRNLERYRLHGGNAFSYVTCEELADAAENVGDAMSAAAALVLRAAAEPPPGIPSDPLALLWGEGYQAVVATAVVARGEQISFARNAFRSSSTEWVKLRMLDVAGDGPWHWLPRGKVCVYVPDEPAGAALPRNAVVQRSGKQWRVDVSVPAVETKRPAADQVEAITAAVEAAIALRRWSTGVAR